jgi:hypothetical protein
VREVVGLFTLFAQQGTRLGVDEKRQIQALELTLAGLADT